MSDTDSEGQTEPAAGRRRRTLVALVGLGALVRVLLSAPLREQVLFADEAAPLLIARLLSGAGVRPSMGNDAMYHAGYPLLLAPFSDLEPMTFYRAALVVNAVLLACIVPLVYVLVRQLTAVNHRRALVIAVATSAYPSFLLHSGLTWTENAVIPVVLLTVVAFGSLVRRRTLVAAVLYGASAALAYLVHPRLLPLVAVALVAAALAWWKQLLDRRAIVAGTVTLVAGLVAVRLLHAWVRSALYLDGPASDESEVITRIFRDPVNALRIVAAFVGQAWYLCVASYGLAPVGVVVLVLLARDRRSPVALHALATAAALIVVSSLFVVDPSRVDQRVYGRYGEAFLAVLLAAALLSLTARRRWPRWGELAAVAVVPPVLAVALVAGYGGEKFSGVLNPFNVLGIEHLVIWQGKLDVATVTAVGVAGGLLLFGLRALSPRRFAPAVGAGLLLVAFAGSTARIQDRWILPVHDAHRPIRTVPDQVRDLEQATGLDIDRLDISYRLGMNGGEFFGYQVLLPDIAFDPWPVGDPVPEGPWIITSKTWPAGEAAGALLVAPEAGPVDVALWVLPGPEQDRVREVQDSQ